MGRLREIEEILREYKHFKAYIRLFEINKEIHSNDEDYVKKQDKKIEYYKKLDLNVERCLQMLSKDELEFIKEIYFNNRTYRETIPLIKKIRYGDGNINRKMTTNISTLLNYTGTEVKKAILNKLLNENILEVA